MEMIDALEILDVVDRGVPNTERVPIKVNMNFELGLQWLGIGIKRTDGRVFPLNDSLIWLGGGIVKTGDWLVIYTGKGVPTTTDFPDRDSAIYSLHWNRSHTIFNSEAIVPYLMDSRIYLSPDFYEDVKLDP